MMPRGLPSRRDWRNADRSKSYRGRADSIFALIPRLPNPPKNRRSIRRCHWDDLSLPRRNHRRRPRGFRPATIAESSLPDYRRAARAKGRPKCCPRCRAPRPAKSDVAARRRARNRHLGCEDFCVLSGLRAHGRYHGAYEDIATRITQFVSGEHQRAALTQLFAMLALSCAVENGDAHLKNFAVLYEHPEGTVQLAPAYDIIATTPYNPRDVLALTIGGSKGFPDVARISDFGRRACGLSKAQVADVLERLRSGVERTLAEIRDHIAEHDDFTAAGEHLVTTFERGLRRSIIST